MASDGYTTVRIKNHTMDRLRAMAGQGFRTVSAQIDLLVSEKYFQVVSVTELPHPADAEPVPLVLVEPVTK